MASHTAIILQALLLFLGAWLAALLPRADSTLLRAWSRRWDRLANHRWLAIGLTALVSVTASTIFLLSQGWPVPRVHDEFSYLLAADTYARGRCANPTPPHWEHFETPHVLMQPTYASKYLPMQGLLLAAGQVLTGRPAVGAVLGLALACAATCWMLQAWLPPRWALLGGILTAVNPEMAKWWGGTYWGGAPGLLGGALVLGAFRRLLARPHWGQGIVLGVGWGILAASRPFEGLVVSLPVAVVLVVRWLRWPGPMARAAALYVALPVAAVLAITLAGVAFLNACVTGSPWRLPYLEYERQYAAVPLFLVQPLPPRPDVRHAILRNFQQLWIDDYHRQRTRLGLVQMPLTKGFLMWLFYVMPALTVPWLALPWTLRDPWVRVALAVAALLWVAIGLTTFFNPHYFSPAVGLFFYLEVRCLRQLRLCRFQGRPAGRFLARLVVVVYLVTALPQLTSPLVSTRLSAWAQARAEVQRRLEALGGRHLVLVHYGPGHHPFDEWVYNGADFATAPILWARSISPERDAALQAAYADRMCWRLAADAQPPALTPCPPP
ncbi:MAG: hypothetical protein NZ700_03815 [Gemmataceae bacterium]|nr:hypothetical protein [Gemmataceae bacterium]MDW8265138.1 hypothetical protein [Gemmataceae bacterium]